MSLIAIFELTSVVLSNTGKFPDMFLTLQPCRSQQELHTTREQNYQSSAFAVGFLTSQGFRVLELMKM